MTPRVSVLIPCFNLGATLDEAVQSVLDQTFQDFEIVVVDDGSTDPETVRLIGSYERPKTRVFSIANRGLPAARNFAIERSTGEYLTALDADDRFDPRFLEKTVAVLDAQPNVAFVSTGLRAFGEEDWVWARERCDLPALLAECTVLTAALVRRSAVLAVGAYEAEAPLYGDEDWDLWIRLVEKGFLGAILPEILFHYRQRPGSMRRQSEEREHRLRNVRTLLERHAASYRAHLVEVLLLKEADTGELLRANDAMERRIGRLEEEAARVRGEVARSRQRRELFALRSELRAARRDAAALRASKSWTITAPLRTVHQWLTR